MTGPDPLDWDDDRITRAFQARSALATPSDLVDAVIERVASSPTIRPPRRRTVWVGLLAASIAIVVVGVGLSNRQPVEDLGVAPTDAPNRQSAATPTSAASSPSATAGPIVLELVDHDGRLLTVEIVDESSLLVSAEPISNGLPVGVPVPRLGPEASDVGLGRNQVRIAWVGGACDTTMRLTIQPGARTIETMKGPAAADVCILLGIFRGVVLTFSEDVPANEIEFVEVQPASPEGADFPPEALGLSLISVEEAILGRDRHADDRELAVGGYWYRAPIMTSCGLSRHPPPILPRCNERFLSLLASPKELGGNPPIISYNPDADGPAITPLIREGVNWGAAGPEPGTNDAVVLIGHFHDRRSNACPEPETCEEVFVVHAVLDPADPRLGPETTNPVEIETVGTPEDIRGLIPHLGGAGTRTLLSAYPTTGNQLVAIDPRAAGAPELIEAPIVWVVRYLDLTPDPEPRVTMIFVVDGPAEQMRGSIFEATPDGLVRHGIIID